MIECSLPVVVICYARTGSMSVILMSFLPLRSAKQTDSFLPLRREQLNFMAYWGHACHPSGTPERYCSLFTASEERRLSRRRRLRNTKITTDSIELHTAEKKGRSP